MKNILQLVILGHKAGIEKFDGYTEAWTKKSLNVIGREEPRPKTY